MTIRLPFLQVLAIPLARLLCGLQRIRRSFSGKFVDRRQDRRWVFVLPDERWPPHPAQKQGWRVRRLRDGRRSAERRLECRASGIETRRPQRCRRMWVGLIGAFSKISIHAHLRDHPRRAELLGQVIVHASPKREDQKWILLQLLGEEVMQGDQMFAGLLRVSACAAALKLRKRGGEQSGAKASEDVLYLFRQLPREHMRQGNLVLRQRLDDLLPERRRKGSSSDARGINIPV